MKSVLYYVQYTLLYSFFYAISLLPLSILYLFSEVLFFLLYHVIKYRRKVVYSQLKLSFPEKSDAEIIDIEKKFFHFLCDYFHETIKLLSISKKQMRKRMTFSGIDEMMADLNGQSCIVYLGHFCNWEWVSSLPVHTPASLHCMQIYHPLSNKATNDFFLKLRGRHGAESISMNTTLRHIIMMRKAKQQFIVGFIADQTPNWANIHHWVDFLNRETPVFTGAERIAVQTQSAVYYLEMSRPKRGYYHGHFRKMTLAPQDLPEHALTEQYFKLLENEIIRHPELWLWSHKRWKRQRKDQETQQPWSKR